MKPCMITSSIESRITMIGVFTIDDPHPRIRLGSGSGLELGSKFGLERLRGHGNR